MGSPSDYEMRYEMVTFKNSRQIDVRVGRDCKTRRTAVVRKLFQKSSSKEGLKEYLLDVSDLEEEDIQG